VSELDGWLADLGSPSLERRMRADAALAGAHAPGAAPALLALLTDPAAPEEARWRAAFALGALGDWSATAALATGLQDGDWSVRHACACALGELGDPAAMAALWAVVSAPVPDEQTNYVAAIGLLRIEPSRGAALLRAAAASDRRAARNTALSALAAQAY
jgi:HEAT repeat protein